MKTKMTFNREKKFDSFEAVNDSMLKKSFGGDTGNPPPEDASDEENLHNTTQIKKIIW